MTISKHQIEQFRNEGFFVLERAMTEKVLEDLRQECSHYIDVYDKEMEARGVQTDGINHYKQRYFINNRGMDSALMRDFLFSELMAEIVQATLGDSVYLFNEQYVVKAADTLNKFAWHQDSGYIPYDHKPYLSCWCALDDMSVANGTIYVLPYERDGRAHKDELVEHITEEGSNDRIGYHGDDEGDPVIVPAGTIVVFSSRTFHRSGSNTTENMRRSYLVQYSVEPIMNKEGTSYRQSAVPFIINGKKVNVTQAI